MQSKTIHTDIAFIFIFISEYINYKRFVRNLLLSLIFHFREFMHFKKLACLLNKKLVVSIKLKRNDLS